MWYLAILVAFGVGTVNGQFFTVNCIPNPVTNRIGGITGTTFALENIACCVALDTRIPPTSNLVFVVGLSAILLNFNPQGINISNPPLFSNFSSNGFFIALIRPTIDLCPLNVNPLYAIRIGDIDCRINSNELFCNGPLVAVGPYSVIVLIYQNGTLIATTGLSPRIFLRSPKDYNSIDTTINHHSASMIAITAILPILLALLLVIFSIALLMKCCCCSFFTPTKCQQE